jgi:hypothetical protein
MYPTFQKKTCPLTTPPPLQTILMSNPHRFFQRANCLSDCLWYRLRTIYFASINHHKHHKGHSARIEIWNYRGYFFNRVRDCLGSNAKAFHEKLLQKRGVLNCVFWTPFYSILGHHRTPIKVLAILHFAVVRIQFFFHQLAFAWLPTSSCCIVGGSPQAIRLGSSAHLLLGSHRSLKADAAHKISDIISLTYLLTQHKN